MMKLFFNLNWILEHILGRTLSRVLFFPIFFLAKSYVKNLSGSGQRIDIPTVENVSITDFKDKFLNTNTPVIIKGGAKDWEACGKWDLNYFNENYADEKQPVIDSSGEEIRRKKEEGEKLEYVTMKQVFESNGKIYANFSTLVHKHKALRDQLKLKWIFDLQNKIKSLMMFQLFIGREGNNTDLHSEISSNLFIMLSGRKKWAVTMPKNNAFLEVPVSREPCFHSPINFLEESYKSSMAYGKIDYYEFVLDEGDVLFLPPYAWHQVINETDSVGLAVKWHNPVAYLKGSVTQSILTSLSINPPLWKLLGQGNYLNLFTDGRED